MKKLPNYFPNRQTFLRIISLIFLAISGMSVYADQIDIGINEATSPPNTIEIKMRPDFTINSFQAITNIVYTVRWSDATITINTNFISPYFVAPQGAPILSGGYYYQVFASVPLGAVGATINPGTEVLISSFSFTGGACASFEIINDAVVSSLYGEVYFELGGNDVTGTIFRPVANLSSIGGSVSGGGTINLGQSTGTLTLAGYSGTILGWQKRLNAGAWNDIPTTSGLITYSEIPSNSGVWEYSAKIQRGSCPIDYATPALITVVSSTLSNWTGNVSSDWFLPGNWSNGVPNDLLDAVIPVVDPKPYPIIVGNASCFNLEIASGTASVTISSSGTLNVKGILTNNAGNNGLVLKSDATGTASLIHSNTGVNATVERYIAAANWSTWNDGWHLLSSPVDGQAITGSELWTPNNYATADDYDFYVLDETNTTGYEYWLNEKANPDGPYFTNFVNGKGYLVAYEATGTKTFTGTLHSANVSVSPTYTAANPDENNRGWNLVGNPFSSAIDWTTGTWVKTNIAATAQVWDEIAQSYQTTVQKSGIIPSMNGFMVYASAPGAALTIPADARIHNSNNWYKSGEDDFILLQANDPANGSSQSSIIRFDTEATDGFDTEFDSYFMPGFAPLFYSVAGERSFALNTLPEKTADLSIPFSFVKNESGSFSIELARNLPETVLYLEDKKTGIIQDLVENPVYNFTAAEDDDAERFILHFGTLSVIENKTAEDFTIWYNQGDLHFSILPANVLSLSLIDMAGRELKKMDKPSSDRISIGSRPAPGWYLVKVAMTDKLVVKKIFINN